MSLKQLHSVIFLSAVDSQGRGGGTDLYLYFKLSEIKLWQIMLPCCRSTCRCKHTRMPTTDRKSTRWTRACRTCGCVTFAITNTGLVNPYRYLLFMAVSFSIKHSLTLLLTDMTSATDRPRGKKTYTGTGFHDFRPQQPKQRDGDDETMMKKKKL